MRRLIAPLLVLAALAGCRGIDYEAQGDDLVRRGDYYGAVDSYKQVPAGDGSPELGSKLQQAEDDLIEDAVTTAQRALDDGRFEEALKAARRGLDYRRDDRLVGIEVEAKRRTVSNAVEVGRLHLQRGEFDEAIAQFETALRYDNSAATKKLLLDAKAGAARTLAQQARRLAANHEYDAALETIERAIVMHDAPEHRTAQRDILAAKDRWIQQQFDRARGAGMAAISKKEYSSAAAHFRTALQYRQSEELHGRVTYCEAMSAGIAAMTAGDLGVAGRHFQEAVDTGFSVAAPQRQLQLIDAERTRMLQTAKLQRQDGKYRAAGKSYRAAAEIRTDERLDRWIRWCAHMQAGTASMEQRDFLAAQDAFERAMAANLPDQGAAERMRDSVRESTWTVSLKTITAKPFKADDTVWDGSLRRALDLGRILAGFRAKRGGKAAKRAADAAALLLPPQNLPDLFVRVTLPDGSVWATETRRETLHANAGAAFTVTGNAHSDQPVVISVRDRDTKGDEAVGTWTTTVGALIAGGRHGSEGFEQVYELTYTVELRSVEPAPVWTSGCTMEKEGSGPPPAGDGGDAPATPTATWTLSLTEMRIAPSDVPNEPRDGAPDAELVLTAGAQELLAAFAGENKPSARWRGAQRPSVTLELPDGAAIQLVLSDRDARDSDVVIEFEITPKVLFDHEAQGALRLETENGSYVEIAISRQ